MEFSNKQMMVMENAIDVFGYQSQKMMAIEECAELINALAKEPRGRAGREDVISEIADVMIMMEQLSIMYGCDLVRKEVNSKLERLNMRVILKRS